RQPAAGQSFLFLFASTILPPPPLAPPRSCPAPCASTPAPSAARLVHPRPVWPALPPRVPRAWSPGLYQPHVATDEDARACSSCPVPAGRPPALRLPLSGSAPELVCLNASVRVQHSGSAPYCVSSRHTLLKILVPLLVRPWLQQRHGCGRRKLGSLRSSWTSG
ncbi:hypothetical protein ZEAMMB73_Zm00001d022031, partial [Zea mays]